MADKKKIILTAGLLIILALCVFIVLEVKKDKAREAALIAAEKSAGNIYIPDAKSASTTPRDWAETETRLAVPEGIKVPEANEVIPENLVNEIAAPVVTGQTAAGQESKIRIFQVRGEEDKFLPAKVIVNINDTVHIDFTAVDKDYDINFPDNNMKGTVKKGITVPLEFRAEKDGRFPYFCETCGGSVAKPQGEIIVVK